MSQYEPIFYILPNIQTPEYPGYGANCNGCGLCCQMEACAIGVEAFDLEGSPGPCPGLVLRGDRMRCLLMLTETEGGLEPLIKNALGAGRGCDAEHALDGSGAGVSR